MGPYTRSSPWARKTSIAGMDWRYESSGETDNAEISCAPVTSISPLKSPYRTSVTAAPTLLGAGNAPLFHSWSERRFRSAPYGSPIRSETRWPGTSGVPKRGRL